ncbi:TonB family protein [Acinetobacter calcoaceticus]|uniref:TonB family protein n=1 Tax=Acinetobacter calcoaceticus TaxID=471 RepID=A0A4R1Y3V2_ACICA|nr:TonB family protein [Acinetobacter calcoaceticus]
MAKLKRIGATETLAALPQCNDPIAQYNIKEILLERSLQTALQLKLPTATQEFLNTHKSNLQLESIQTQQQSNHRHTTIQCSARISFNIAELDQNNIINSINNVEYSTQSLDLLLKSLAPFNYEIKYQLEPDGTYNIYYIVMNDESFTQNIPYKAMLYQNQTIFDDQKNRQQIHRENKPLAHEGLSPYAFEPENLAYNQTSNPSQSDRLESKKRLPESNTLNAADISWSHRPNFTFDSSELLNKPRSLLLTLQVSEKGEIKSVQIKKSTGLEKLDQKIVNAVMKARFKPYIEDGVARAFTVQLPLELNPKR